MREDEITDIDNLVAEIHFKLLGTIKHVEDFQWTVERIQKFLVEQNRNCDGKGTLVEGILRSKHYFDTKRNL